MRPDFIRNIFMKMLIMFAAIMLMPAIVYSAPYKKGMSGIFNIPDAQVQQPGSFVYNVWTYYQTIGSSGRINVSPVTVSLGMKNKTEFMLGAINYDEYQQLYEKNSVGMIAGAKWIYRNSPLIGTVIIGDNLANHPGVEIREIIQKQLNRFSLVFNAGYLSKLSAAVLSAGVIYFLNNNWDILFDTDNWIVNKPGFTNKFEGIAGARYYFADNSGILTMGIGGGRLYTGKAATYIIIGIGINSSIQLRKYPGEVAEQSKEISERMIRKKKKNEQKHFEFPTPQFKMRVPIESVP